MSINVNNNVAVNVAGVATLTATVCVYLTDAHARIYAIPAGTGCTHSSLLAHHVESRARRQRRAGCRAPAAGKMPGRVQGKVAFIIGRRAAGPQSHDTAGPGGADIIAVDPQRLHRGREAGCARDLRHRRDLAQ
jgi:hypothetical protein